MSTEALNQGLPGLPWTFDAKALWAAFPNARAEPLPREPRFEGCVGGQLVALDDFLPGTELVAIRADVVVQGETLRWVELRGVPFQVSDGIDWPSELERAVVAATRRLGFRPKTVGGPWYLEEARVSCVLVLAGEGSRLELHPSAWREVRAAGR